MTVGCARASLHARYEQDAEERRPQRYEEDRAEGHQPQPVVQVVVAVVRVEVDVIAAAAVVVVRPVVVSPVVVSPVVVVVLVDQPGELVLHLALVHLRREVLCLVRVGQAVHQEADCHECEGRLQPLHPPPEGSGLCARLHGSFCLQDKNNMEPFKLTLFTTFEYTFWDAGFRAHGDDSFHTLQAFLPIITLSLLAAIFKGAKFKAALLRGKNSSSPGDPPRPPPLLRLCHCKTSFVDTFVGYFVSFVKHNASRWPLVEVFMA